MRGVLLWSLAVLAGTDVAAQQPADARRTAAALTQAAVEALADSVFAGYMQRFPEPSLAVVVVRADEVVLAKGYGHEDPGGRVNVDPYETLFNMASLSKLVTATAALQLVETGRLDLNRNINEYLQAFSIEEHGGAPVSLWHLLTHTSGLDSPFMRGVVADPAELVPLRQYFAAHTPRRGRPPGREIRYSNDGLALAGHLVELASGIVFADYAEQRVFTPLGMRSSSFRQPPPQELRSRVATAGSGPVPDALLPYPSGSLVSTAADMGHFMRAHLRRGELDGNRVLSDSISTRMQQRQWSADPRAPGVALGFFETGIGGRRGLFHTGARAHFSVLYLLPEEDLGVFLVHSMRQGGEFQSLRTDFIRAFVNRFAAPAETMTATVARPNPELERYEGVFRPILVSGTTIERAAWLGMDTRVTVADGHLIVAIPGGPRHELSWIDRDLFRVAHGPEMGALLAFQRSADGSIDGMSLSGTLQDPVSFDRLAWYERGTLHALMLGAAFIVFLSCIAGSLVAGARTLVRGRREHAEDSKTARATWGTAALASLLVVSCPVSIAILVMAGPVDDTAADGLRFALTVGLTLLLAGGALVVLLIPLTFMAWRRRYWNLPRRLYLTGLVSAGVIALVLLGHYHLLGYWY